MPRGGDRSQQALDNGKKIGRPKTKPEVTIKPSETGIATRVLAKINEEGIWLDFLHADKKLSTLNAVERSERKWAIECLTNRRDGKPAQGVFMGDTRESKTPIGRGDLPTHFEGSRKDASGAHKPN